MLQSKSDILEYKEIHFVGIFGIGMSAIAAYLADEISISGSDRSFGAPETEHIREKLTLGGCLCLPQDGESIPKGCQAIIVSTAIENSNPDIAEANRRNIPIFHRSELLAEIVNSKKSFSVTGTSGKSTVAGMLFHILQSCGYSPSLISGANLHSLITCKTLGNSHKGESELLVIEADESDGTVTAYHPFLTAILNISKDHKEIDEIKDLMSVASKQSNHTICNGDDANLRDIAADATFGRSEGAKFAIDEILSTPEGVSFKIGNTLCKIPFPGIHTAENGAAAIAAAHYAGVSLEDAARALYTYRGVERRFDKYESMGLTVIDDYAHNPDKVSAAIRGAQTVATGGITAIFQPHGHGPFNFLFHEFCQAFKNSLRDADELIIAPIYYAGGTVTPKLTTENMVEELKGVISVRAVDKRDDAIDIINSSHKTILLLGARDPSLPIFAKEILSKLSRRCDAN